MKSKKVTTWNELKEMLEKANIEVGDYSKLSRKFDTFIVEIKKAIKKAIEQSPNPVHGYEAESIGSEKKTVRSKVHHSIESKIISKLNDLYYPSNKLEKYIFLRAGFDFWQKLFPRGIETKTDPYKIIEDFIKSKGTAGIFLETELLEKQQREKTAEQETARQTVETEQTKIVELANSICKKFLENNYSKYQPGLFEDRTKFSEKYNNFANSDDNNFFLILGESGVGKTNVICNVVEKELANKNNLVFPYDSSGLDKRSLEEIEKLLPSILSETEKESQKKAIFLFDAINESTSYCVLNESTGYCKVPYLELMKDIDSVILKNNYKNVKVIVSCRTFSWYDVIRHNLSKFSFKLTNDNQVEIRYFTKEELFKVYPKYETQFNQLTSVDDIKTHAFATVCNSLLDPLQLRWIAEAYAGKQLPQSENELNYENLCFQKLNNLEDRNCYELIYLISKFLIENRTHFLNDADLFKPKDETLKEIKRLFKDNDSEYTKAGRLLIDANFLKKDTLKFAYRFEFDRIQEAMFAHVFVKEKSKTNKNQLISVDEFMKVYAEKEHDVVYINFLRDALINDFKEKGYNNATIKELALTSDSGMQKLSYHTLSKLMHKHYNPVYEIIESIIENQAVLEFASKTTMDLITDLFIPTVYQQSKSYDKKPVALLQKIMAGSSSQITNQLGMNIYIITRRNKERAEDIINELFKYAHANNQLNIEYLIQLGVTSFILSTDIVTQMKDLNETDDLKLVTKTILGNWKKLSNRLFTKKIKIKSSKHKNLLNIFNGLPLFIRNPLLKYYIKKSVMKYGHVQSDFVNNLAEYQRFWTDIPKQHPQKWSRNDFCSLTPYLNPQTTDIQNQKVKILKGYESNNAFSYILLERLLIIQGTTNWNNVSGIINEIYNLDNSTDYSRMSLAYVLFHIIEKSESFNEAAFDLLSNITKDWSQKTKGKFSIITHGKDGKKFKQHILNWYIVAYFKWHEYSAINWQCSDSIKNSIPVFIELVEEALHTKNKDLLFYILENIGIVATDFGNTDLSYIEVAIRLFDYIVRKFETKEEIINFNTDSEIENYNKDLPTFMSKVLCTMDNYYPMEIKGYLETGLYSNLESPLAQDIKDKMKTCKEELEGLGGLLTHRSGNFIVWGCKNSPEIREFFIEILKDSEKVKNINQWAFIIVEKGVEKLIGLKI